MINCRLFSQAFTEPEKSLEIAKYKFLSIGFASQSYKSPVSFFGHTFLVAHDQPKPELESIAIEFVGDISRENGIFSALLSSVEGYYNYRRFYDKLREYNLEDRGVWTYRIKISEQEKAALSKLILKKNRLKERYSFIRTNCAYKIYELIQKPLSLSKQWTDSLFLTLPIQSLKRKDLLARINESYYFPSQQEQLSRAFNELDAKQKKVIEKYSFNPFFKQENTHLDSEEKRVLGKAIDYKILNETDDNNIQHFFKLKKEFSSSLRNSDAFENPQNPIKINKEQYISLSNIFSRKTQSQSLAIQFFQRDFLSTLNDSSRDNYLEGLKPEMTFSKRTLRLSRFTLFKIQNISEKEYVTNGSVKLFDISFYDRTWTSSSSNKSYDLKLGFGYALKLANFKFAVIPHFALRYLSELENSTTDSFGKWNPKFHTGLKLYISTFISNQTRIKTELDTDSLSSFQNTLRATTDAVIYDGSLGALLLGHRYLFKSHLNELKLTYAYFF